MDIHPQADNLNETIRTHNTVVYELLSQTGKCMFFPKQGIIAQTKQAKETKVNATIGQAFLDDKSPMCLPSIQDTIDMSKQEYITYAQTPGLPELRKKWHDMIREKNPSLSTQTSLPLVTCGLTHGLRIAAELFINENTDMILPDLSWGNYNLIFKEFARANLHNFKLLKDQQFNTQHFQQTLDKTSSKKVVLLNVPNNPTGYALSKDESNQIVQILTEHAQQGNHILVIIDDAYFGLTYESSVQSESLFAFLANAHENILTVKIDGATKEDYAWGLRVGFITYGIKNAHDELYESLIEKTAGLLRASTSNTPHISQSLLLKAFNNPSYKEDKQQAYNTLKKRYNKIKATLQNPKYVKHVTPLPFNAGYFMCLKPKNVDPEQLRKLLIEKYSTGIIVTQELIRISFASVSEENISLLLENIYNACEQLSK